ncbi:secretion protein HlyD, partial [Klebsiella pneumoniae]
GATLEAAVYSDHLKELSLIRKILMRMKSWENYIYLDH